MTEQKPHWINLTCMKCGYRYSGLTHAAPSACPNDGESLVPYDPPAQRIASLEAEVARLREALNRMLVHWCGNDDNICPECGEQIGSKTGCDTCYVIEFVEAALGKDGQ